MHDRYIGYRRVPFYSQKSGLLTNGESLSHSETIKWENNLCGLACALMVLNKFSDHKHSPSELFSSAIKIGAYNTERGWIHHKLASMLKEYGIQGITRSVSKLSEIYELLSQSNLIIASVAPNYANADSNLLRKRNGHLILIIGMLSRDSGPMQLNLHDPGSRDTNGGKNIAVDWQIFERNFSGNIITFKKSLNKLW